jgi:hypothetical protein
MEPSELIVNQVAAVEPKETPVAPVKLLPVSVTTVPPAADPEVGAMAVIAGTVAADTVKWSAEPVDDVPALVTTVMSTVPAASGGDVAMICVSDSTVNAAAAVLPKFTPAAPVKLLPVIVTMTPPAVVPEEGETLLTAGAVAAVYVNWSDVPEADVPVGVVTVISTVPAGSGGVTATICVSCPPFQNVVFPPMNHSSPAVITGT